MPMGLQMAVKVIDPIREDGNLHLGRSAVALMPAVVLDDFGFTFGGDYHVVAASMFSWSVR